MSDEFVSCEGDRVETETLEIPKAREFARIVESGVLNWVKLVECRRYDGAGQAAGGSFETVIIDLEVEVPQHPVHDIRRIERVAVVFDPSDRSTPEVLALRSDFPSVPHLNQRAFDLPRSLCLFDRPYSEVRLALTSPAFIERIRTWLRKTALGDLHEPDQPLEPLLAGSQATLVLPHDVFDSVGVGATPRLLAIVRRVSEGKDTYVAERLDGTERGGSGDDPWIALTIVGSVAQQHGIILKQPETLQELHEVVLAAGVDLLALVRSALDSWRENERLRGASLALVIALPKVRASGAPIEATDVYAFLCFDEGTLDRGPQRLSILDLGSRLGMWDVHNGVPGVLIGGGNGSAHAIALEQLNSTFTLSRYSAAALNGAENRDSRHITAVGGGALGSQVFLNLVRSAYGEWTIVDNDILLPHNAARHGLPGDFVGMAKAKALAVVANDTIDGEPIADYLVADVLDPGPHDDAVRAKFSRADVILDMSASVAVARFLSAANEFPARRASVFLSPSGRDSVLLVEDSSRRVSLSSLEAQYYRFLLRETSLRDHFETPGQRVRYARSCRDLSSRIPQELVSLHAAVGARALRTALAADDSTIAIWRAGDDGTVRRYDVLPVLATSRLRGGWSICYDESVLDDVRQARLKRLPCETGGVLIGMFDVERKTVYVAAALSGPPDSQERLASYTRGCSGLEPEIEEIRRITHGNLDYAGEWHTHPEGHDARQSDDDRALFAWLLDHRRRDGFPAVMLIVGEGEEEWYAQSPFDVDDPPRGDNSGGGTGSRGNGACG